jgi:hypothetical protein
MTWRWGPLVRKEEKRSATLLFGQFAASIVFLGRACVRPGWAGSLELAWPDSHSFFKKIVFLLFIYLFSFLK